MGLLRQGILGGFRKKTGSVVGAYWRTLDVIRGLPRSSGKAPTQAQKDQQLKFGLTTGFLSWISDLVFTGYKSMSKIATPMNVAVSYNISAAITGVSPNFTLDYAKIRFSNGKLALPDGLTVESLAAAKLKFSWLHADPDDKLLDATDMATILVYNPVKAKFVKVVNVVPRSAGTYTLQVPASFADDDVHCYISFNSLKHKELVSVSQHLGLVNVIA